MEDKTEILKRVLMVSSKKEIESFKTDHQWTFEMIEESINLTREKTAKEIFEGLEKDIKDDDGEILHAIIDFYDKKCKCFWCKYYRKLKKKYGVEEK